MARFSFPHARLRWGSGAARGKPFEILYTLLWYIGPLHAMPPLDFMGSAPATAATRYPLIYLALTAMFMLAALAGANVTALLRRPPQDLMKFCPSKPASKGLSMRAQILNDIFILTLAFFGILTPSCAAQQAGQSTNEDMARFPGATIQMGIDAADVPRLQKFFNVDGMELFESEMPKHSVVLDGFYLDRHLVTNSRFKKFTDANPIGASDALPTTFITKIICGTGGLRAFRPEKRIIRS